MTQDYKHPIAPPPELVEQWLAQSEHVTGRNGGCRLISVTDHRLSSICSKAAQWGADQELDACCGWMNAHSYFSASIRIREDRRPRSEKQQALEELDSLETNLANYGMGFKTTNIRRALESIPTHD